MSTLWLLFAIVSVGSSYFVTRNIKPRLFTTVLVASLSLMIGFCGLTLQDHASYEYYYETYSGWSFNQIFNSETSFFAISGERVSNFEIGYIFLNILGNMIGLGPAGFFTMIAIIVNTLMINVFKRFKYPVIAVLIYIGTSYFSQQANLVRQMLAVSVILYALQFIESKKWKHYLLLVFLASLIHTSAIIFSPLALFTLVNNDRQYNVIRKTLFGLWLISLLFGLKVLHVNFMQYIPFIGYYSSYSADINNIGANNDFDIKYNILVLFLFYLSNKTCYRQLYLSLFFIGGILLNLAVSTPNIYRIGLYLAPLYCVFIPESIQMCSGVGGKNLKSIPYMLVILYVVSLIMIIVNSSSQLGQQMYNINKFLK